MKSVLSCMERVEINAAGGSDGEDIFGQYIATELDSIENQQVNPYTKWRIQSVILHAHSGHAMQSSVV